MAEVYHNNIIDIDLESGTLFRSFINHTIGSGDNNANWFGVRIFRDGEPIPLAGCSVQGLFMPAEGSAILISDATHTWIQDNEAAVLLPQACYAVKGRFTLTIKIIGTNSYSITDTVRIIDGVVADTYAENPVAPTAAVPTYQEILAVYDQMVAAKDGSVRFDIEQELTAAQMTQARGNIAAASESDVSDLKSALTDTRSKFEVAGDIQLLNPDTISVIKARVTTQGELVSDNNNYYAIILPYSVQSGTQYTAKYYGNSSTFGTIRLYSFSTATIGSYAVNTPSSYGASGAKLPTTATANYLIAYFLLSTGTLNDVLAGMMFSHAEDFPAAYHSYYNSVVETVEKNIDANNNQLIQEYMPTAGDLQLLDLYKITIMQARVTTQGELVSDSGYYAIALPYSVEKDTHYIAKYYGNSATFGTIRLYSFSSVTLGSYAVDSPTLYGANGSKLTTTATANYFLAYFSLSTGTLNDALAGFVISHSLDYPPEYTPYYVNVDFAIHNAIKMKKSPDCIEVGSSADDYAYTNINTAWVENPTSVIKINYGTYETEVEGRDTDKILIGADVDLCILTGTNKNYDTPPIEMACGMVKNLTVIMVNDESAEHKGYCLHSDNVACTDNTLIVSNCKFNCVGQHAIGMGIFKGETVVYENCEFVFKDVEDTPTSAPFFAHNAGGVGGDAIVKFHNCIFRGSGYAMKLSAWNADSTLHFEFINCTCESDTMTGDEMIWTDYISGGVHDQTRLHEFSGKMLLMKTSHGNNIDVLNY